MKDFINAAVFAIFTDADNASLSFAERLLAEGIGDRATARPYAVAWAAKKHTIETTMGQRGLTFKSTDKKAIEAAQKAVTRVLEVCFPSVDVPSGGSKAPAKPKADAVQREAQRILKNFTPAQRRKLIELLSA
jgi:hypothetical protein